ncbi:MAG: hypothetical protein M1838_003927 [Thelocarpon superellum]|nr:MAG: hypothetical protein M1838_003927 [Thelocarpon superellum]
MSFLQSAPTVLHDLEQRLSPRPKPNGPPPSTSSGGWLTSLVRLVRMPGDSVAAVWEALREGHTVEERAALAGREHRTQILYARQANAATFGEWRDAAEELDLLEGNHDWKATDESPDYNAALVEARLKELDEARISCDVRRMLFLVRTSLTRGLGDMGNIKLYQHSHIGTKNLIERYINSTLETLDSLVALSARHAPPGMDSKFVLEQILSARQSFGRSALLLSGGATFGMSHIGVLKTLWEARLLPRIISGASAGSIVCSVICTQTDEQIPALLENFAYGDLSVFEPEGTEDGILKRVARFLKFGAWIDIAHLVRVMKELLGDMTFQEAYNRTRRILNICVSSASLYELPRLLNYVTAPNVLIWSAVAASCSVPLVFSATSLLAKDPKTGEAVPWNPSPQRWIDGSVDNDLPMTRLAEMFNVNHFIVSQVNPHVVPFLAKDEDAVSAGRDGAAAGPGYVDAFLNLAKGEALHRMHVLTEMGIFPNTLTKCRSVLSQRYSGDITIFPEISYANYPRMLTNPTTDFMLRATVCGERATWSKLSRVRNHCAIELALDDAVQQLRARVVFSPSQVNLRLSAFEPLAGTAAATSRPSAERGRGRGRAGRVRRTGSQDIDGPTGGLYTTAQPPAVPGAERPTGFLASRSTTALHHAPTFIPSQRRVDSASRPPRLSIPHLGDVTSSGGDTSHSPHESSDHASDASSSSSPSSPSYFRQASTAASQTLFPFASQPATPHWGQKRWGFFSMVSPPSTRAPSPSSTPPMQSSLIMTPSTQTSSPDAKQRRAPSHRAGAEAGKSGTSDPKAR